MSETKTPVEVAAEALASARHEAKKQGMDVWPLADVARAVFGSVDVDGLARVLRGTPPQVWETVDDSTRARWHVEAERVIAWLTGGGA